MPCSTPRTSPRNISDADQLQYAAIERVHIAKLIQIEEALRAFQVPLIKKNTLDCLSISLGTVLDVGRADAIPTDVCDTFFAPCDWPLDVLEYETWRARGYWRDLDQTAQDPAILLQFARMRNVWYEQCLYSLQRLVPRLWDVYRDQLSIQEQIGLSLPFRLFHPRPWKPMHYHEYYGKWAMFAPVETKQPHASCLILDSGYPRNDSILLSEAEAAVAMIKYQLQDGTYTNHHTKPALVVTMLRNLTARLTQAYFDGKQNKLVLRQSRVLDLSGAEPSPDSWILLRWIASRPVGETQYTRVEADIINAHGPDPTNLAPSVSA